jgi:ATP/ADP translocase
MAKNGVTKFGKPDPKGPSSSNEGGGYPALIDDIEEEDAAPNQGLLNRRRKTIRESVGDVQNDWLRPYCLGFSLFLVLFAFWILDSLKDPIFAKLVDGNLERHQPLAKLFSVTTTLILVCLIEYISNARQQQAAQRQHMTSHADILNADGQWTRMDMEPRPHARHTPDDTVSISTFHYIGIPYVGVFFLMTFLLQKYDLAASELEYGFDIWYVLAYVFYAGIESFGSLAVATFWSYTNSTLSLDDAERFYGPIIAIAQLGAIGGSTMVATNHWEAPDLIMVACLMIVLQMLVMRVYDRRFTPTSMLANDDDAASLQTWQDDDITFTKPFWSGVYLIVRHNYVLLILGVSCLYEVSLTCLDYQMKLLGWARFELTEHVDMSFSQFMGHYGQVVNMTSLLFSSVLFPWLIRKYGLRVTLRLFPTLLFLVTLVTYGAIPGNLTVLFLSMSFLKAMTYSIHDPSKEILYIPTSNAVKFRAKFWIDVVGARISKAIGSGINTYAGSVDRSIRVSTVPSLLTAAGLWLICYYAGIEFDRLLVTGKIVGLEQPDESGTYMDVPNDDDDDDPSPEAEISFDRDAAHTLLGLPIEASHHSAQKGKNKLGSSVEMTVLRI